MAREVTLVDAGLGNLASVERALIQVGAAVTTTDDADRVARSRCVVFPGQGAFGNATDRVVDGALGAALRMVIERGDPFLGICVGMQLLFDSSEENGGCAGLGVLPGRCVRFPEGMRERTLIRPEDLERVAHTRRTAPERPTHAAGSDAPAGARGPAPRPGDAHGREDAPASSGAAATPAAADALVAPSSAGVAVPSPAAPDEPPSTARTLKVPHMGWNQVEPTGEHYYFLHSYYSEPARSEDVMWMSTYGSVRFPAAVRHGNVLGCQFHPEKSQRAGLKFLRAFLLGGWS